MLLLTIKTDQPEAEVGLFENNKKVTIKKWQAHRQLAETIHSEIKNLLDSQKKNRSDINGIVCFKGPGSFTGLRIGLTVTNSLAYSLSIPIVGSSNKDWQQECIKQLLDGKNQKIVKPEYGAEAHITEPKK